jgi:hypothetical protein
MTDSTELAVLAGVNLQTFFTETGAIDPIIQKIRDEVSLHVPDLSTSKGRKEIGSLAYKVSRSKTALQDAAKLLTADAKAKIKVIDDARIKVGNELDAIRDLVRAPLTKYEAEEELRTDAAKAALSQVGGFELVGDETSEQIKTLADKIKAVEVSEDWGAYIVMINSARDKSLATLRIVYTSVKKSEEQREEITKMIADQAARDETARLEAERIANERAEADRLVQVEAQKVADIKAAAEKAELETAKRAADLLQAAADKKEAHERAVNSERLRVENEAYQADQARMAREADADHRAKIQSDIIASIKSISEAPSINEIALALLSGNVAHCEVKI